MIKMKIVVPFYNCEIWIKRCLLSIATQQFKNWECVVINDASTDKSKDVLDNLEFVQNDPRFSVIHNPVNVKALKNIVDGFNYLKCESDPDAVMMVIDGDDFLYSEYSLHIVSSAYSQYPSALLTYGNWVGHPDGTDSNCQPYDLETVTNNRFRYMPFVASHLRTFKSKIWYNINDEDLRDSSGEYFVAGWDVAFMMPMLEMSGERHIFIPNRLYCYNRYNPISDCKIREKDQLDAVRLVQSRKPYKRIDI
jgi:glycosyltransferase involved in cell wall biosynthesis